MTVHDSAGLYDYNKTQYNLTIDIPSDSDRILALHFFTYGGGLSVSSVVLDPGGNNEALTQVGSSTANGGITGYTYRLVNPTAGAAQTLRVTVSSASSFFGGTAISFYGMDTTTIVDGTAGATGSSTDPQASPTSSLDGGHVTGAFFSESNTSPGVDAWSGVTGQTTVHAVVNFGQCTGGAYATQTSAGSVTADFSTGQSQAWVALAAVWPVAESNTPPTIALNTADESEFTTATPTVEFTGSDDDSDDLRYQVQIGDSADFDDGSTYTTEFLGAFA